MNLRLLWSLNEQDVRFRRLSAMRSVSGLT